MGLVSTTTLNPSAVGNGDSRPVILRVGALQVNVSLPFPTSVPSTLTRSPVSTTAACWAAGGGGAFTQRQREREGDEGCGQCRV